MKKKLIWGGIVIAVAAVGLLLWSLKAICMPFILGFILAYVLRPLMIKLSKKYSPTTAARLTLFCLLCFFLLVLFVLFPVVQAQLFFLIEKTPAYVSALLAKVQPLLVGLQDYFDQEQIASWQQTISSKGLGVVREIGAMILNLFSQSSILLSVSTTLVITPIMTYYFLKDWNLIMKKISDLIPRRYMRSVDDMFTEMDSLLSAFLRGQCLVCLSLALYYGLALSLIGLHYGLSVGILTGLFEFIPYLGVLAGFVFSLILAGIQGTWSLAAWVVVVFLFGQILEGYILTPRLVGKRVGLSPALVIFVVLAGGALFGFFGVLLAIPVTIILGVPLRMLLRVYRSSAFYKDKNDK